MVVFSRSVLLMPAYLSLPFCSISIFSTVNEASSKAFCMDLVLVTTSSKVTRTTCSGTLVATFSIPSIFFRVDLTLEALPPQVIPGTVSLTVCSAANAVLLHMRSVSRRTANIFLHIMHLN